MFIIIDDRNPNIKYKGIWNEAGSSPEYNGTTSWTKAAQSTASINFWGSQISVVGTIPAIDNGASATTTYSIDNETIAHFMATRHSAIQYQQTFFMSNALSPSEHTLKITNMATDGQFYLDFINITALDTGHTNEPMPTASSAISVSGLPSTATSTSEFPPVSSTIASPTSVFFSDPLPVVPTSTSTSTASPASMTRLDDRSPSFKYQGEWIKGSGSHYFNGTNTWTNTNGSVARIIFTGVQISVYGGVNPTVIPNAFYSIDGMPQEPSGEEPQQPLLFQSVDLDPGTHILLINSSVHGQQYILDYATVRNGNSTNPYSISTDANTVITSPAASMSPVTPISGTSSLSRSSQAGPIAGGVVGGLCIIALVVIGSMVLKRSRKRWSEEMPTHLSSDPKSSFVVTPPSEAASSILESKSQTESVTGKPRYLRSQTTSYQSNASASSSGLEYVDDPSASGNMHSDMRLRSPGGI